MSMTERTVVLDVCNGAAAESTTNSQHSAHTGSNKILAASTHCMSDIIITEVLKIGAHIQCNALDTQ